MNLDKEIIGKKIRQIRKERGLSQEELSEKIDISPRHMCTIENGNSFPSIETFIKISEILDIDINEFFNLTPQKNDTLRGDIYNLIQTSSIQELHLIKDIISAIQKNRLWQTIPFPSSAPEERIFRISRIPRSVR